MKKRYKILMLNIPAHGHVNPTLAVVKELVGQGHRVIYYNTESFRQKIEPTGAEFRLPPLSIPPIDLKLGVNPLILAEKVLDITDLLLSSLSKIVKEEKPDCIIYDASCLWGKIVAKQFNIPAVSLNTIIIATPKLFVQYPTVMLPLIGQFSRQGLFFIRLYHRYQLLRKKYHLSGNRVLDIATNMGDLNIVFTSKEFQPFGNDLLKDFLFVGPSISTRKEQFDKLSIPDNKPLIYISMGTIYNDDITFYKIYLEALADSPYHVIMAVGDEKIKRQLKDIPANFTVKQYVSQLEVLQRASLFISHAGLNSISESIHYQVPLICIPQMIEQKVNAKRIEQLGAGIYLNPSSLNPDKLRQAVETVMHNESFKKNAAKIEKSFKEAGGYKRAAEEILHYLSRSS